MQFPPMLLASLANGRLLCLNTEHDTHSQDNDGDQVFDTDA